MPFQSPSELWGTKIDIEKRFFKVRSFLFFYCRIWKLKLASFEKIDSEKKVHRLLFLWNHIFFNPAYSKMKRHARHPSSHCQKLWAKWVQQSQFRFFRSLCSLEPVDKLVQQTVIEKNGNCSEYPRSYFLTFLKVSIQRISTKVQVF